MRPPTARWNGRGDHRHPERGGRLLAPLPAGPEQRARGGPEGSAGRGHIIDEDEDPPAQRVLAAGADGSGHVGGASARRDGELGGAVGPMEGRADDLARNPPTPRPPYPPG